MIPKIEDARQADMLRSKQHTDSRHTRRKGTEIAERDEKPSDTDIERWRLRHER